MTGHQAHLLPRLVQQHAHPRDRRAAHARPTRRPTGCRAVTYTTSSKRPPHRVTVSWSATARAAPGLRGNRRHHRFRTAERDEGLVGRDVDEARTARPSVDAALHQCSGATLCLARERSEPWRPWRRARPRQTSPWRPPRRSPARAHARPRLPRQRRRQSRECPCWRPPTAGTRPSPDGTRVLTAPTSFAWGSTKSARRAASILRGIVSDNPAH